VRIDVEKKEYITIVEKGKITNVSVVKYVFTKRKTQTREPNIDIRDNMWIVVLACGGPVKGSPIKIVGDSNNNFALFI